MGQSGTAKRLYFLVLYWGVLGVKRPRVGKLPQPLQWKAAGTRLVKGVSFPGKKLTQKELVMTIISNRRTTP
jgi:hypothetical protein